jgi:hypothetical protein
MRKIYREALHGGHPVTAGNDADQLHRRLGELVGAVDQQCQDVRDLCPLFELQMGDVQSIVADLLKNTVAHLAHKVDDVDSCNAALLTLIQKSAIDNTKSLDAVKRIEEHLCSGGRVVTEKSPAHARKQHAVITVDDDSDSSTGVRSSSTTSAANFQVVGRPGTGTLAEFFSNALLSKRWNRRTCGLDWYFFVFGEYVLPCLTLYRRLISQRLLIPLYYYY